MPLRDLAPQQHLGLPHSGLAENLGTRLLWVCLIAVELMVGATIISVSPLLAIFLLILLLVLFCSIFFPLSLYLLMVITLPLSTVYFATLGGGFSRAESSGRLTGSVDLRLADPFLMLAILGWVFFCLNRRRWRLTGSGLLVDVALIGLVVWTFLSGFWSPNRFTTFIQAAKMTYGVVIFYATLNIIEDRRSLKLALAAWYVAAFLITAYGLVEFLTQGLSGARALAAKSAITYWRDPVRTTGFQEHADRMGLLMTLYIGIVLPWVLKEAFSLKFMAKSFWLFVMYLVQVTSLSRSSWLALSVGMSLWAVLSKRFRQIFIGYLLVGAIVLAVMVMWGSPYLVVFWARLSTAGLSVSEAIPHRVATWMGGLEAWWDSPLVGTGFGGLPFITGISPHSVSLGMLVETGLIGFLLFAGFMLGMFRRYIAALKCASTWGDKLALYGFGIATVMYLVWGSASPDRLNTRETWALWGLGMAAARIFLQEPDRGGAPSAAKEP